MAGHQTPFHARPPERAARAAAGSIAPGTCGNLGPSVGRPARPALDPAQPDLRHRVAWIVGSRAVHRVVSFAVPLLVTPLALRTLGQEAYGAWVLVGALGTYLSFTFGIPQVLVDVAAASLASGDRERLSRLVRHAFLALLALAAVVAASAPVLAHHVHVGVPRSTALVMAYVAIVALSLPLSIASGLADGLQRTHEVNLISSAALLVATLAVAWGLRTSPSVLWLLLLPLAGVVASGVVGWRLLACHPWLARAGGWSWPVAREVVIGGSWFTLIGLAWMIIYSTDVWVVKLTSGLAEVAPYGLAFSLFSMLGEPLGAVVLALRPLVARLGRAGARDLLRKNARLGLVMGLAVNGAGLLWFGVALDAWLGSRISVDFRIAAMLAGFQAVRAFVNPFAWALVPTEGPRALALALTGDAAINLGLSLLLGRLLGPWGVAAGSLAGMAACSGWYIPLRARRVLGGAVLGPWTLPALLGAAPLWAAAVLFQPRLADFRGSPGLLACALLASALWCAALIFTAGLEREERGWVMGRLRARAARRR